MSRRKKFNEYKLDGEYGIGFTSNTNKEFFFDLEDFDLIKQYCWNEHKLISGYRRLEAWDSRLQKVVSMQRVILGTGYDHINHNTLDNRKSNLRLATQQENVFNRSIQKTNTSGVIGVEWRIDRNKWIASIRKNGKRTYLGQFDNLHSAIKVRLLAELEYFGDFAPQSHLFADYGIQKG